ncbi:MAG: serine/threonine-protein kinase [Planctomycetota bacterium]
MDDPLIGTELGNFRIRSRIGAGGMGTVYLAHNPTSRRDVALKVLRPAGDAGRERQYRERFLREIQVAARIQHEHVVRVVDAGLQGSTVYLVMELVRGCSLGDRIDQDERLPADEVRRIALAVAEGLVAIHRQGVVHRDIKPDNVLLGSDGNVKITDLGLARHLNDESFKRLTVSGMVVGTPYYLAPEAIRDGRRSGPPSDIYSFGATLYHCLAGVPPFDAPSSYDVMRMHLEDRHRPLREIDRSLPRYLVDMIDCCLDKDPDKRPSAHDCALALRHGGRMRHETRGMAFVAVVLVGLIGATAAVLWQIVGTGPVQTAYAQASGERTSSVLLRSSDPDVEVRIDDGAWLPWRDGPWFLSPGVHRLAARSLRDGDLYTWNRQVELDGSEERSYRLDLQPLYLELQYPLAIDLDLPPGHVLFHQGRNRGTPPTLHVNTAGSWLLAAWDGVTASKRRLTVHRDGSLDASDWQPCNVPPPAAYLRNWIRDDPAPAHHVVSWWECERARRLIALDQTPTDWELQAARPEQPALGLDSATALIDALLTWRQAHGLRLPTKPRATTLARAYDSPVWYHPAEGGYRVLGGNPGRALLVLVPEE